MNVPIVSPGIGLLHKHYFQPLHSEIQFGLRNLEFTLLYFKKDLNFAVFMLILRNKLVSSIGYFSFGSYFLLNLNTNFTICFPRQFLMYFGYTKGKPV